MPLPLMPGDEPIEIKYKEPEPQGSSGWDGSASAGVPGCTCLACQGERRAAQRFRLGMFFDEAPQYAAPAPTRRQIGVAPRPGLIQGVYDFRGSDTFLNGNVRWLDPNTGEAYDELGRVQWTFVRDAEGWVDRNRPTHRFLPDGEVSAFDRNAPGVFNWS